MTAYRGEKQWAPCFHGKNSAEEEAKATEYVRSVLPRAYRNASLEDVLWCIALGWYDGEQDEDVEDIKWGFYADQWVGVSVEVHRKNGEVTYLWTEGDSFTLAVAKSVERLKAIGVLVEAKPEDDDDEQEGTTG